MLKPDYRNSIVNLVATIQSGLGGNPAYPPLNQNLVERIRAADNVMLLLLDGLGYHYLQHHAQGTLLDVGSAQKLTSVFPTTTSSAITSISTGLAPAEHGVTGWFMYLHNPGLVAAVLPFMVRGTHTSLEDLGVGIQRVVDTPSIYLNLQARSFIVSPEYIVDSVYSQAITPGAKRLGYKNMPDMFSVCQELLSEKREKKYIYAYWPEFDALCHEFGVESEKTHTHFRELSQALTSFTETLKDSNTLLLVTADHGLLDTSTEATLLVNDHPELQNSLALPLCGEPRAAYCYVRPDKEAVFVDYVRNTLTDCCEMVKSQTLTEQGYFGTGTVHPQLERRIGDYVLLMKDNYIIKDRLLNERAFSQIGVHGGLSDKELYVPLFVFD